MLDFVGIGAQKAGTTWLYANLQRHPEVAFPATKEVHFWDARYANGIDWYKSLFPAMEGKKLGEITPAYAILSRDVIKQVYKYFPHLKLIYLVRDPVERAWSSALMALKRAEMNFEEASDQWFIDHFNSKGSLMRGDYATCIQNWRAVYPPEQLLILSYHDIKKTPETLLQKCAEHIGISPDFFAQEGNTNKEKVFEGDGHPISQKLKDYLCKLYKEKIKELQSIDRPLTQNFSSLNEA